MYIEGNMITVGYYNSSIGFGTNPLVGSASAANVTLNGGLIVRDNFTASLNTEIFKVRNDGRIHIGTSGLGNAPHIYNSVAPKTLPF